MIRLVQAVIVLFGISLIAFVSVYTQPDVASLIFGREASPELLERLETEYGLNEPLPTQYVRWLTRFMQVESTAFRRPLSELIGNFLPATAELVISALLLIWALGSLIKRLPNKIIEILGAVLHPACVAILLILIFGFSLRILPLGGRMPVAADADLPIFQRLPYLIMPAIALAIPGLATYLHWSRLPSYSAGLTTPAAVVATLLSNVLVIETIFSWPGVGRLFAQALMRRDLVIMPSLLLIMGIIVTVAHLSGAGWITVTEKPKRAPRKKRSTQALANEPISILGASELQVSSEPVAHDEIPETEYYDHLNGIQPPRPFLPAIVILGIIVILAAAAPLITQSVLGVDASATKIVERLLPPGSPGHILGTDRLGRDQLARLLVGTQTSLFIGAVAGLIATIIALALAALTSTLARPLFWIVDTLVLIVSSLPILPFLLALMSSSLPPVVWIMLMGVLAWTAVLRWSQTALETIERGNLGAWLRVIASVFTLAVGTTLTLELSLSFLGLGVQPPTPSWGNLLNEFQVSLSNAPEQILIIIVVITLTLFCVYTSLLFNRSNRQIIQ